MKNTICLRDRPYPLPTVENVLDACDDNVVYLLKLIPRSMRMKKLLNNQWEDCEIKDLEDGDQIRDAEGEHIVKGQPFYDNEWKVEVQDV
jgi:hypothetical protein